MHIVYVFSWCFSLWVWAMFGCVVYVSLFKTISIEQLFASCERNWFTQKRKSSSTWYVMIFRTGLVTDSFIWKLIFVTIKSNTKLSLFAICIIVYWHRYIHPFPTIVFILELLLYILTSKDCFFLLLPFTIRLSINCFYMNISSNTQHGNSVILD